MASRRVDPEIETLGTGPGGEELWLVKVNQRIATSWLDAPEGANLGFLDIVTKADGSLSHEATLVKHPGRKQSGSSSRGASEAPTGSEDVSATVVGLQSMPHTAAFRVTPGPKPVVRPGMTPDQKARLFEKTGAFEGRVSQRMTLRSEREREDTLEAHLQAEEQRKVGRVVSEQEVYELHHESMEKSRTTFTATVTGGDQRSRKRRRAENKLTAEGIKDHIFACFSKEPHLTLKMINGPVNQSEERVKNVLKKYAEYNTGGENRGKWTLKPEFKDEAEGKPSVL